MNTCVERAGVVVEVETLRGETTAQVRLEAAPACAVVTPKGSLSRFCWTSRWLPASPSH